MLGWHFVGEMLRDGRPIPPDGEVLRHDGPLIMCKSGLHFSRRILDALEWAPGSTLCRVDGGGEMIRGGDKIVCRERPILWRIDATDVLLRFARCEALDVAHLWDCPEIVLEYLRTGDEGKREQAYNAAWDAAMGAAWGAARCAASGAAWDAARGAAWGAARCAASGAAWDAARGAARDAASGAAANRQNRRLAAMIVAARKKEVAG